MASIKEDIEEFVGMAYEELVKDVESKEMGENAWDYYASDKYAQFLFYQAVQKQSEPAMSQALANLIESYYTQPRILDYRCGIGMTALALSIMNCRDITLADVPNKYFRFLRFISDKYVLGFQFIELEQNEYPLKRTYDVIICDAEILEPELTLPHLYHHLAPLGYLIASFDDKWLELMEGIGFKKAFQDEVGVWIFQKI